MYLFIKFTRLEALDWDKVNQVHVPSTVDIARSVTAQTKAGIELGLGMRLAKNEKEIKENPYCSWLSKQRWELNHGKVECFLYDSANKVWFSRVR